MYFGNGLFHNACEPETFFAVALEKRVYRLKYIPVFSLEEPNTLAINIQLSPEGEVSSGECIYPPLFTDP